MRVLINILGIVIILGAMLIISKDRKAVKKEIVLKAIDEVGYNKLKSIKEVVPQEISYDAIRAIVLKKVINELA